MAELTIEEQLEKYPYLKPHMNWLLFITAAENEENKTGPKLSYLTGKRLKTVSLVNVNLLIKLVTDERYYLYVKKLFNNEIEYFKSTIIINGDIKNGHVLNKMTIVIGLQELMKTGHKFDDETMKRVNFLIEQVDYHNFVNKNKEKNYNLNIEGYPYVIPVSMFINFLELPPNRYENFFDLSKNPEIGKIPKEYFVYALISYYKTNNVSNNYLIPFQINERLEELITFQKIDYQAINECQAFEDKNVKKTIIDAELKMTILANMPTNVTLLEKAMYIYLKMCKILTYDEEYYVYNQRGEVVKKHENIDHVAEINLQNNKVVCYEFNIIYAKLLAELGIDFQIDSRSLGGFGGAHANLRLRQGKFIVEADSVTSILQGDMVQAKLNQPLVGLKCLNINQDTQAEFRLKLSNMYYLVARQELKETQKEQIMVVERVESFADILRQYQQTNPVKENKITLTHKLTIIIAKVKQASLYGVDAMSYILQLKKILFNNDELRRNFNFSIIRENNNPAKAVAVFTINEADIYEDAPENNYYIYCPPQDLTRIDEQEIAERFNNGYWSYINNEKHCIPGISIGGKK